MQTLSIPGTIGLLFDSLSDIRTTTAHEANALHTCAGIFDPKDGNTYDRAYNKGIVWYGDGINNRREALRAIETGHWAEGKAQLESALSTLAGSLHIDVPRSKKRRRAWGDAGDECDIDRLRRGDYDTCWTSTRRTLADSAGRIVRLLVQTGGSYGTDASEMFWSGAAAMILTDLLETAGYRVEIFVTVYAQRPFPKQPDNYSLVAACIKSADEPANLSQIATTLCMAGFTRTYFFHAAMSAPIAVSESLGRLAPVNTRTLAAFGLYQPGDIIVPMLRSLEDAKSFTEKTIRDLSEDAAPPEYDAAPTAAPYSPTETPAPYVPARPPYAPPTGTGQTIKARGETFIHRGEFKSGENGVWKFHKVQPSKDSYWEASADDPNAVAFAAKPIPGVTFTTA